ncbi:MAG: hypothetical protein RIS34_1361, partial [Pseudomonadota bacterium]
MEIRQETVFMLASTTAPNARTLADYQLI